VSVYFEEGGRVALRVQCCETLESCTPFLADWAALAETAAFGEWFAGPEWIIPLIKTYFTASRLAICFVYKGEALVGVVPLTEEAHGSNHCRPHLAFPVNPHVRRIGLLASVRPEEVLQVVFAHLAVRSQPVSRSCLGLLQVPEGEWLDCAVRTAAEQSGLARLTQFETRSAVIDVPNGWQEYVASRTSEQLHPLRKQRKLKARNSEQWEFRETEATGDFADCWARVLHVESRSWKHADGTSLVNDLGAEPFYWAVAMRHAQRGKLRIDLLERNGEPVAHTLGVVHGRSYYLLKHSYDEAHRALSPGFQTLWFTLERRVAEGCTRLDLLGDEMSWKRAVATSLPRYVSHQLFTPTSLACQWCRLTEQVLKPIARAVEVKRLAKR
jgi:CelD/BcsL family acetyltransferase involved in cellulose biosynthesis